MDKTASQINIQVDINWKTVDWHSQTECKSVKDINLIIFFLFLWTDFYIHIQAFAFLTSLHIWTNKLSSTTTKLEVQQ